MSRRYWCGPRIHGTKLITLTDEARRELRRLGLAIEARRIRLHGQRLYGRTLPRRNY